ncbi:MAG: hypothetical protein IJU43_00270 [Lachnospiraceae bacterium]|nr:hypothetical protein [Lachnospiraceae bacterium]
MKKWIITLLISALAGTMLCACGSATEKEDDGKGDVITDEGSDTVEESDAEENEDESGAGSLAIAGPTYTGLSNLRNDNNPDGSYFYEDMTEDGITIITNMSYPNSQRDGQDMDAYAENIVCAQVDNDAVISETVEDTDLAAKLSYPVYKISWESGSNEDTKQAVGVVVLTDNYTFYYGYKCPIDFFEENEAFYNDELQNIELIEP